MTQHSEGLTQQTIVAEFDRTFPDLVVPLRALMGDDPPSEVPLHPTLVAVLSDTLLARLGQSEHDPVFLRAFASFLERMATSGDGYVRDLASTGVIENLLGSLEPSSIAVVRREMGPVSRSLLDDMEARRRRLRDGLEARRRR